MTTPWWKLPADEWQAKQRADGASTDTPIDSVVGRLDLQAGDRCPRCEAAELENLPEGGVHCPNCGFAFRLAPCT